MNDLRIQHARQIEASIREAAQALIAGFPDKAWEISEVLKQEHIEGVDARIAAAFNRLMPGREYVGFLEDNATSNASENPGGAGAED